MTQNLTQPLPLDLVDVVFQPAHRFPLLDLKCSSIVQSNVPFAVWQAEYLTGHQEIDREHQELFQLVNSLHSAMQRGKDRITLKLILEELAEHTLAHFQQEEMLMKSCAYPKYERHKQTHDGLKTKIVDLLQKFSAEETLVTVAITQFLTDWLVHHINGEDRKLTEFLHGQL